MTTPAPLWRGFSPITRGSRCARHQACEEGMAAPAKLNLGAQARVVK